MGDERNNGGQTAIGLNVSGNGLRILLAVLGGAGLLGSGILGGGQLDLTGARNWRAGMKEELASADECQARTHALEAQVAILIMVISTRPPALDLAGEVEVPPAAWGVIQ